MVSMICKVTEI